MAITVKSTRPVGEPELLRAEASLGVSIPEGYRTFLQATDGGRAVEDTFLAKVGVTDFLGAQEIVKSRSRLRGRLPENLLPIANAEGGNLICISIADGENWTIYFWDHELEHLGAGAAERLAPSFDEFVSQLRVLSPQDLPPHRVISVDIDPGHEGDPVRVCEELSRTPRDTRGHTIAPVRHREALGAIPVTLETVY